ncbi:PAS domain-containing protein [Rickettsiella grylli]|uniref:histidine kinase n=1 Tax=Rickettsiella grylli TaxID=59196 RepID=A8PKE1_9COXI|nr:PAS domain-containing protein [Rickettsiella grylli]EDP45764.1 sensory box histidine kinase/response regulator [Rickettsiella grylli]
MQHTNSQNNKFAKDKYFDHLLSLTPSSVYWKNLDGIYLGCNLAMLKMIGVSFFEDIIGKTDYDLSWKESADTLRRNDEKVIQSRKLHHFEETGKLSDGTIQTMITNKMPLVNKEDKIIGIIGSSIDITPLKKSAMDLILAKEKAEVANQAKTEFLENMRHDIRTPLSGIVGCAHLIQMQSNNPKKVKEYTSDLIQSSNALLEFLNKILESLKVASGEMPLLKKRFSLKAALEQIVRLNKSQAIVKGLVLSLRVFTKLCH